MELVYSPIAKGLTAFSILSEVVFDVLQLQDLATLIATHARDILKGGQFLWVEKGGRYYRRYCSSSPSTKGLLTYLLQCTVPCESN